MLAVGLGLGLGLGLANGPSSSVATASVTTEQVGAASGISNMGRCVGAAVLTAVTAAIFNAVRLDHQGAGAPAADALASGSSRAAIGLALFCAIAPSTAPTGPGDQ